MARQMGQRSPGKKIWWMTQLPCYRRRRKSNKKQATYAVLSAIGHQVMVRYRAKMAAASRALVSFWYHHQMHMELRDFCRPHI